MKRFLLVLFKFLLCFVVLDGLIVTGFYFLDIGRGSRAATHPISLGNTHSQVLAVLGEPASQLKVGPGGTIEGVDGSSVPERWFYGPMIRWQLFTQPRLAFDILTDRDLLVIGLAIFYHRARPDRRDLVIDFDTDGRVIHIIKPTS